MITRAKTLFNLPAWRGRAYYFLYWGALASFGPFLNVYFSKIGLSGMEIGFLAMLTPIATLTTGPLFSMLADRQQWHRQMLALCLCGLGSIVFLYQLPRQFGGFLLLNSLYALFFSPLSGLMDGLIARMSARHHLEYGTVRLWGSLSFAVISVLCGALWQRVGYGAMFTVGGLLYLPVIWMAFRLEGMRGTSVKPAERMPLRRLRQDHGTLALLLASFLIGISETGYVVFSGMYVDRLGGGQLLIGMVFGFSALVELPTMQLSSRVIRRLGHPRTLLLAYSLLTLSSFGYAASTQPWMVVLCAMIKGVGFSFYFITTVSLVDLRVPEDWAATLQSLVTAMGWGLAPLLMSPLGGWLADTLGLPSVFVLGGVANMLAIGIIGIAHLRGRFDSAPLRAREVAPIHP